MFLGMVFWQWFLVAAGFLVAAIAVILLGYCFGHKSVAWTFAGQAIGVIFSGCATISGFIGVVLIAMTIIKSSF